jgi:hypothetical protein
VFPIREDRFACAERELLLGPVNLVSIAVGNISRKIFVQFHGMELREVHVGVIGPHVGLAHGQLCFIDVPCATRHDRVGIHFACFFHQDSGPSIENIGIRSGERLARIEAGLRVPMPDYSGRQRQGRDAEPRKIAKVSHVV